MIELKKTLELIYDTFEGSEELRLYSKRHGIESAGILTVHDDEMAAMMAAHLEKRIAGKTVVEIGGGIGLLSMHMGFHAKRVYCIEANPIWAGCFTTILLRYKPKNVSYLFGAAEEFVGSIKGDVALFASHSGIKSMKEAASQFAPEVIDIYGEIIALNPKKFNRLAIKLRSVS